MSTCCVLVVIISVVYLLLSVLWCTCCYHLCGVLVVILLWCTCCYRCCGVLVVIISVVYLLSSFCGVLVVIVLWCTCCYRCCGVLVVITRIIANINNTHSLISARERFALYAWFMLLYTVLIILQWQTSKLTKAIAILTNYHQLKNEYTYDVLKIKLSNVPVCVWSDGSAWRTNQRKM